MCPNRHDAQVEAKQSDEAITKQPKLKPKSQPKPRPRPTSRRSRQFGAITAHACEECRKKRTKCDGKNPCSRCARLGGNECVYKSSEVRAKAELRQEVRTLRDALATVVPASDLQAVLDRVRQSGQIDGDVLLQSMDSHLIIDPEDVNVDVDISPLADRDPILDSSTATTTTTTTTTPTVATPTSLKQYPIPFRPHVEPPSPTWTCVTDDLEAVRHLLALYFCWEYPNFAPISKEHFLQDFHVGRPRYCSPVLVNALLALACHISDRPNGARAGTSSSAAQNYTGDAFFAEAYRLVNSANDNHHITMIQALGIMSLREARCCRIAQSKYYAEQGMLLATEMGLHLANAQDSAHADVISKAFWGLFNLNQAWSMLANCLPPTTRTLRLPPKPAIVTPEETSTWSIYVDGHADLKPQVQLSNVRSVYRCFCSLNEIVNLSVYMLNSPTQRVTAGTLLELYQQHLVWYDQLPAAMKLGQNFTPAVFFIHIYYHFSILILFRKAIHLRIIGSQISPYQVSRESADAIQRLVDSYASLYTLRRAPVFLPYFVFGVASVYLDCYQMANDDLATIKRDVGAIRHTIDSLASMATHNQFAEQSVRVLCKLAREWNINVDGCEVPAGTDKGTDTGTRNSLSYSMDRQQSYISHVRSRRSYSSPNQGIHSHDSRAHTSGSGSGSGSALYSQDQWPYGLAWLLDNTISESRQELAQAGFALV